VLAYRRTMRATGDDLPGLVLTLVAPPSRKEAGENSPPGMSLHCISPYEMLRRERARFVLAQPEEAA
jgi:hypothetical protein